MERLFVYGTLAPGKPNEKVLAGISGRWTRATLKGKLFDECAKNAVLIVQATA